MRLLIALSAILAWAGAAHAGEKPEFGPAPAWVQPVEPAASAPADDAPVQILLNDQQVSLEPGRSTIHSHSILRIQNPQGLAAGNIFFAWQPDTDVPTVHKLLIHRGDEVIDVLASGQTFTIARREANLESATLDGVLTATIQPEGLRVGDEIEFAVSLSSSDPVLNGHVEHILGGWNMLPMERAHFRAEWPSAMPVRFRATDGFPKLKPRKSGGKSSIELSLDDLEPVLPPKGAPARFALGRMVELTDYGSWSDIGALMAPLYAKAATLPAEGPLRTELARIEALSPDPKARAEAALALVQDRVRYVALMMGEGGYVPADAETTWSRRFGDCKAKTALLLALLHELGIEAEPVAVSTVAGDGMDQRLPMVGLFNHVLVRAEIGGRAYWLDGTRTGDKRLDEIQVPGFGWGLPLVAEDAALVRMVAPPLDRPMHEVSIHIDARQGLSLPAPTKVETVLRGDMAVGANMALANLVGDARDRTLREYWRNEYDFIEVETAKALFDEKSGELRMTMEGAAELDWNSGSYETDGTGIGYKADFSREPGSDSDAPFAVAHPFYTRNVETILLPEGVDGFRAGEGADVRETVAGIEYRRQARIEDNVFTIETTSRSLAHEFPAKEAPAAEKLLRALAEKAVYLKAPANYRPTKRELEAALDKEPATAAEWVTRGNMLLDQARFDEAIADFDRAAALDPKNVWAFANRGLARVWKGETEVARKDLEAAAALDPRNPVIFRARGLLAAREDMPAEAVAAFSTSLEIDPGNSFTLGHRAIAQNILGKREEALSDSATAIELNPRWVDLYLLRANLFTSAGETGKAIAEADALAAANPKEAYAQVAAARIYGRHDRKAAAMQAFDRALAIKPEAYIYVNRSEERPKEDYEGRLADIEAALRLEPDAGFAIAAKAKLQGERGDMAGAAATWSKAVAASPDAGAILVQRGIAYARMGKRTLAEKDFAAAQALASQPFEFNNMCWAKATAGVALESALTDCEEALKRTPESAAYLDSRGLVLLRLGRVDEAIAEYDRAIAKRPNQPSSLFGRAIAWAKKGEEEKSEADAAAALKANPDVREEFEGYGLTL